MALFCANFSDYSHQIIDISSLFDHKITNNLYHSIITCDNRKTAVNVVALVNIDFKPEVKNVGLPIFVSKLVKSSHHHESIKIYLQ